MKSKDGDIKEKKELKVQLELFASIINSSDDAIISKTLDGIITSWNPGAQKLFGYTAAEIIGKNISILIPAHLRNEEEEIMKKIRRGKIFNRYETDRIRNDGSIIYVSLTVSPVKDEAKNIIGASKIVRDISEQKRSEQRNEFDQNNLRSLINNTKDLMWSVDRDLNLITCNDSFNRVIELASGKPLVKGDNILSTQFTKEQLKRYKTFYSRALSGEIFTIIDHFKYPDEFWVEISFYPIRKGNTVIGTACFSRDITAQKKTLEEMESTAEQLRKLTAYLQTIREKERKRIAREIHDELGQQLTAIKMDAVWIEKKIPAEAVPVKNKLKNIITLLDRSDQSVRNILNELRPAILDDHGLLDALEWQNRQFTDTTGIPVKFITAETAITLPEEIVTSIFRVYQESLTNIMRYAKARKVKTTLSIKDNTICLDVEDNGKGFDPAALPIKKSFGILGMKERVLSLNGTFELISSPGKGTKINICLPCETDIPT